MHISFLLFHTLNDTLSGKLTKEEEKVPVEEDIWLLEQTFSDSVVYRWLYISFFGCIESVCGARAQWLKTDSNNVAFMQISSCVYIFFSSSFASFRLSNRIHRAHIPATSHAQSKQARETKKKTVLIITVIVCSHNITNRMKLVFGAPHCRSCAKCALFFSLWFCFFFAIQ